MPKANHPEDSRLIAGVQRFQPILCKAKLAGKNESDTVTIIVDMLSEVFGFDKYEQITSELQIKRTFCDLAIKIDGKVCLLIECKAVGVDLKEDHVSQATGYAANYGIDYVALTNGLSWSVYRVLFEKPVEITPVCSFEFCDLNVNRPDDLVPLRCLCRGISGRRKQTSRSDLFTAQCTQQVHSRSAALERLDGSDHPPIVGATLPDGEGC